jgi:Tol biopolymer transport system component
MTFSISAVGVNGSNRQVLYDSEYGAFEPAWSPDGRRIAFSVGTFVDYGLGLWVMNADGSDPRNIGPNDRGLPPWSPDGSEIAFVTNSGSIDVSNADGSGRRTRVAGPATFPDWTPDGRLIFTKSPSQDRYAPGQRIFISDGGLERQLNAEAAAPARSSYSDRQATWQR